MDFLKDLGALALGSRFRRLTDRLAQDVAQIYRELDIDFEPRWFPVYYLLHQQAPMGVVDIARMLGVSHPAINQIAGEMIQRGLLQAVRDDNDKRKRLLSLTDEGLRLQPALREIWEGVYRSVHNVLEESDSQLIREIDRFEQALAASSLHQRFLREFRKNVPTREVIAQEAVEIIPYDPAYREDFRQINQAWIERYFVMEPEDERVLGDPEATIIRPGGYIWFARLAGTSEILGTCALLRNGDGSFELAKMGVVDKAQGRQIGKQLLLKAIEQAQSLKAPYLSLETNSGLKAAINLYTRLGFVLQSPDMTPEMTQRPHYQRGDVLMRLAL